MDLLVLGGTQFVGRHLVEAALERGHRLTLFNRGRTNPDLFPQAERLQGDRNDDLSALAGRRWDAVLDVNGYLPRQVTRATERLRDAVGLYAFISTISVFADFRVVGQDEDAPLAQLTPDMPEDVTDETYGPLKARCEQLVQQAMPGWSLVVRPGMVVGPHDHTDRFTYWPWRVARGGEVLAPGRPSWRLQLVDARDLAAFTLALIEAGRGGVYNATGPAAPLTMRELLDTCHAVSGGDARLTWVDEAFLLERGVQPWSELPFWLPDADEERRGLFSIDTRRAQAAGLSFRPLAETVRDTLAWAATRPPDHEWQAGLPPEREQDLLAEWHAGREVGAPR